MQYLVPKTDDNIRLLMHYVDASAVLGLERVSGAEYIALSYLPHKLRSLSLDCSTFCETPTAVQHLQS